MRYLSVHDLVWINSTITGKQLPFNYETLEQAMAAQYKYGVSTDVAGQAANLLQTFLARRPFAYGNRRSAYIATVGFLQANGFQLTADDSTAAKAVADVAEGKTDAQPAIAMIAKPGTREPEEVSLRAMVSRACNDHSDALNILAQGDE